MFVFIAFAVLHICCAGTVPAAPENITVTFLNPSAVRVSWQTMLDLQTHPIEKYVVTYKPTNDRVVHHVAGNSEAVTLDRLSPSTQYSVAVTAVWLGKKYRSRQIVFRTMDLPRTSPQQDSVGGMAGSDALFDAAMYASDNTSLITNSTNSTARELPPIRGVEVGIVLIVLMVWAGAIALFFNRWGKIRMLLPYQPDYKHEQLKVPGTGVCNGSGCNGQHSHQLDSIDFAGPGPNMAGQSLNRIHFNLVQEEPSVAIAERCSRSRINSAIFVSSEGRGFDSIEFLRRHGSQSVLCRKAKSAENITTDERQRRFSENREWDTEDSTHPSETIELTEHHPFATPSFAVVSSTMSTHLTTVTTANAIVGSISIETPPQHIQQELSKASPHNSPKSLNLKCITPKISNLPTLSISGPSPPHENEEFL